MTTTRLFAVAIALALSFIVATSAARTSTQPPAAVALDSDDIGGVVTGP